MSVDDWERWRRVRAYTQTPPERVAALASAVEYVVRRGIPGDFVESGPEFIRRNPHLIVALLYLDFDLYEPTAKALELFLPLMPAGAVVAFDELHAAEWPGETQALLDRVRLSRLRLERFAFTSISYAILAGDERVTDP